MTDRDLEELLEGDANAWRAALLAGRVSVRAALDATLERLERAERGPGGLNAVLSVDADGARARADALDAELAAGQLPGALFGVPVALKANLCAEGLESSCGSKLLAGWRAPYTATCVERLIAAGAIPVATTNMDEFAMGSSGENSAFGPTRNPWDAARAPGGSSSGSAAVVAARVVPLALGSDTGGSVRQPAAFCGLAGFKPTSLLQPALLPELADEHASLAGLRIGVAPELFPADGVDPEVRAAVEAAIERLVELGAERVEVHLPHAQHAVATYYVVAAAEASSNLARFDGVRYGRRAGGERSLQEMYAATREAGFGEEVKRRILLGTYVLSHGHSDAWYVQALRVRRLMRNEFDAAFERADVIVAPTAPTPAFALGAHVRDPLAMYRADTLTVPASLAGLPALSVPCGFAAGPSGPLPIGLQVLAPPLADARALRVGRLYAEATSWSERRPPALAEAAP